MGEGGAEWDIYGMVFIMHAMYVTRPSKDTEKQNTLSQLFGICVLENVWFVWDICTR